MRLQVEHLRLRLKNNLLIEKGVFCGSILALIILDEPNKIEKIG